MKVFLYITYLVRPEKKNNQIKTVAFRVTVKLIAIILKVMPTSSLSGFNLTLFIILTSKYFEVEGLYFSDSCCKNPSAILFSD